MKGIRFGTKHSFKDFGLILTAKEISSPDPKLEQVDVPGMDGKLDLTDALGTLKYKNRKLSFTFTVIGNQAECISKNSEIENFLHGKKMQVILDDDPSFYYEGRCTVDKFKTNKRTATIQIDVDASPYKMDVYGAGDDWLWDDLSFIDGYIYPSTVTVNGTLVVNLPNRKKVVSPTFTASASGMSVIWNGKTFELTSGAAVTVYDILLQEGNNTVTLNGTGTVKIQYKGGSL